MCVKLGATRGTPSLSGEGFSLNLQFYRYGLFGLQNQGCNFERDGANLYFATRKKSC